MAFLGTLHVFILLVMPLALGDALLRLLKRVLGEKLRFEAVATPLLYCTGLFYLLFFSFFLRVIGLPWVFAAYLPCIIVLVDRRSLKSISKASQPEPTVQFLLWFFVVVSIGLTLCISVKGIQTSWVNNYGDLSFHLGLISSFVFGNNIPPEYHIYAGSQLSYPFLMNFWTALLWAPYPDWRLLSVIFTVQWSVVWILIYKLLSGERYPVLPWALLLGGGSFFLLGEMSTDFIRKGYPWSVFISTIWVPQRTFMLGILGLLTILQIAFKGFSVKEEKAQVLFDADPLEQKLRVIVIGFLLGVTFLVHGHTALVTTLFLLLILAGEHGRRWLSKDREVSFPPLPLATLGIFVAVFAVTALSLSPWFLGKSGIIKPIAGWIGGASSAVGFARLQEVLLMWSKNIPQVLILFLPLVFLKRYRSEAMACAALFILFNFVEIAAWTWDQLKVFIVIYAILLALWSFSRERILLYGQIVLLLLLVPGLVECYHLFQKGPHFTVYDVKKLEQAAVLHEKVPVGSILAAAPEHHSAATLSGRSLFMGYPGTLWSHSIKYRNREAINKSLLKIAKCPEENENLPCPQYLLWDTHARKYWQGQRPEDAGFKMIHSSFLYQVKDD